MNQDDVKGLLLLLYPDVPNFAVTFSGKKSFKVDGLYKPEHAEIIIHNRNFKNENALIYTAIHEFAHHIQFTKASGNVSCKAHTVVFWDIFHRLLIDAEGKDIYKNIFKTEQQFIDLAKKLKSDYLSVNGHLMKEFGELLINAYKLCHEYDASFEDFVDRELGLHRTDAKTIMKTFTLDINPDMGYENMKIASRIKDDEVRKSVESAFFAGKSPDMVKAEFCHRQSEKITEAEQLISEKDRIRKTMERLKMRLAEIDEKLNNLEEDGDGNQLN